MSLISLAWRVLRGRLEAHLLTAAVVALGMALMLSAVATEGAARDAFRAAAARFPLVVGGEVGAIPLVLGSLTGLQDLPGHVDGDVLAELRSDPRVELAVPLLGGHAAGGHPVLATSPDYLRPRERFPLAQGRIFESDADEAVLGAGAAQGLALGPGDRIVVEHGHGDGELGGLSLRVVGVLAPTRGDADQTVFVALAAVQRSHEAHAATDDRGGHEGGPGAAAVGAVLVRPVTEGALLALQEELEARPGVQVALTGQTLRRLSDQLSAGGRLLRLGVTGVVILTFLALLLAVYGTALASIREVAVMRMLGARRIQVVAVMGSVALAVVALGTVAGIGIGALLAELAEGLMRRQMGLEAHVALLSGRVPGTLAVAVGLLSIAGIQPAIAAYAVSAAEALSDPGGAGRATRAYLQWSTRALVVLVILAWGLQALSTHGGEVQSHPLDPESSALYASLGGWGVGDAAPAELQALAGQRVAVQGYMYALGDPFTVEDFYLVAINPRLPRCPFCYRSPGSRERIRVRTDGRTSDVLPGLAVVTGRLTLAPDGDDPVVLDLQTVDAVLP